MAIENFTEVQEYLNANNVEGNEVKTYLDSLKVEIMPTLEVFKGLTSTDADYKSFIDSTNDKHTAKSLETWKTNNLDKLYQERYAKEHPTEDPTVLASQLKYKELEDRLNASESKNMKEALTNKALKTAQEKKLPTDLIDFFVGADDEITTKNMDKLIATMAAHDEAIKLEFAKGNSYTPPNAKGGVGGDEKVRAEIAKYMK